jgi:Gamma tubulin complex component C-terminal/Gamma tubulin complex component N-terminal
LLVSSETAWGGLEEHSGSHYFHSLSQSARQPFLATLSQWLAYGELPSHHGTAATENTSSHEFMIRPSPLARLPVRMLPRGSGLSAPPADVISADRWRNDILSHLSAEASWYGGYLLQREDIPHSLLSDSSAAIAVAIGKAVAILRRAGLDGPGAGQDEGDSGSDDDVDADGEGRLPSGFSEADSLRLLRLLSTFRSTPSDALPASTSSDHSELKRSLELLLTRLRDAVFSRLWLLLTRDGAFMRHAEGIRDFLLLGRGDFYRSLLERLPSLARAYPQSTTSDSSLAYHIAQGPWAQAAALTDIVVVAAAAGSTTKISSASNSSSSSSASFCFDNVSVRPVITAFRWDASTTVHGLPTTGSSKASSADGLSASLLLKGYQDDDDDDDSDSDEGYGAGAARGRGKKKAWWEDDDDENEGEEPAARLSARSQPTPASSLHSTEQIFAAWTPSHLPSSVTPSALGLPPIARLRYARSQPGLLMVGSAGTAKKAVGKADPAKLCLSTPSAAASSGMSGGRSGGAVWAVDTVFVRKGCFIRASVDLAFPTPSSGIATGSASSGNTTTASFSLVIQRDGLFSLGTSPSTSAAATTGAVQVPLGGHEHIANSLALHFLVKPLGGGGTSTSTSPEKTVADGATAAKTASPGTGGRRFRVVAAAYGPPPMEPLEETKTSTTSTTPDGRALLASGAVMEMTLLPSSSPSSSGAATTTSYRLDFAVELLPKALRAGSDIAATEEGAGDEEVEEYDEVTGQVKPRGRLYVSVLDRNKLATTTAATTTPITQANALSATRMVIDGSPLDLDECLRYDASIYRGAGRERAWIGLTAPAITMAVTAPSVSLQALDFVAYGEPRTSFLPSSSSSSSSGSTSTSSGGPFRDPLSSFSLTYRVPWPLHLVLTTSIMSQIEEMGDLLLRARRAAMSLQEAWRSLMAAFSSYHQYYQPQPQQQPAAVAGGNTSARTAGAKSTAEAPHSARSLDNTSSALSVASGMTGVTTGGDFYGYGHSAARKEREKALVAIKQRTGGAGGLGSTSATIRRSRQEEQEAERERQEREKERALRLERNRAISISTSIHHGLLRPLWLLRTRMSHLVDSLVSYWQSDVVESGFSDLRASVAAAPNYLALVRAHDRYIDSLRAGLFYNQPSLLGCVDRTFGCVDAFVGLLQRAMSNHAGSSTSSSGNGSGATNNGLLALVSPGPGREAMLALHERFSAESRMLVGLLHAHGATTSSSSPSAALLGAGSALSFGGAAAFDGSFAGAGGSGGISVVGTAQVSSLLMRLGFNGFFE